VTESMSPGRVSVTSESGVRGTGAVGEYGLSLPVRVTSRGLSPAERFGGGGALSWVAPYLDPYDSCLMRLMRLLDVLGERG